MYNPTNKIIVVMKSYNFCNEYLRVKVQLIKQHILALSSAIFSICCAYFFYKCVYS